MAKLIFYWGRTARPGITYYQQKLSNRVLGIYDLLNRNNFVYLVDETVTGEKDSDNVCSHLSSFIDYKVCGNVWILKIYLDSAAYLSVGFCVVGSIENMLRRIQSCSAIVHGTRTHKVSFWCLIFINRTFILQE